MINNRPAFLRQFRFIPRLELLEHREVPVVGAFDVALPTADPLYNGVVRIHLENGTFEGTGVLLDGVNYILTAGHVVADSTGQAHGGRVDFLLNSSEQATHQFPFSSQDVNLLPGYHSEDGLYSRNDLAVIRLNEAPPVGANGFQLYRNSDEIGKPFTLVGFGNTGNGVTGAKTAGGIKRIGANTFEATSVDVKKSFLGNTLFTDFDNGTVEKNTLKIEFGIPSSLGEKAGEILIETGSANGDSGGPAFIRQGEQLFIGGISSGGWDPFKQFGGLDFYTRVSFYSDAIDRMTLNPDQKLSPGPLFVVNTRQSSQITIHDSTGAKPDLPLMEIQAFSAVFKGGVSTAFGDVNHDGFKDVIAGAGPGGGPHVKVISGVDYTTVLHDFFAFETGFQGGVSVASADMDGDLIDEILVGAGPGGGPRVRVFRGTDLALLKDFFAFEPEFKGGVSLAAGLLDNDAQLDLVIGAGPGGGPRVKVFQGLSDTLLLDFFAFDPSFRGGVSLAVGDLDGQGRDELIFGAGPGGGPHVKILDSQSQLQNAFFAYDQDYLGGVEVALASQGDHSSEILTSPGLYFPERSSIRNERTLKSFGGRNMETDFSFPVDTRNPFWAYPEWPFEWV